MRAIIRSGLLVFESEGERTLYRDLWRPGDPLPLPQVWVRCGGRHYRLDFAFLDARLCIEYDGRRDHECDTGRFRDGDRDLALAEQDIQHSGRDRYAIATPNSTENRPRSRSGRFTGQTLRISARMLRTPEQTRRRILTVRAQRMALGLPAIVPAHPPR